MKKHTQNNKMASRSWMTNEDQWWCTQMMPKPYEGKCWRWGKLKDEDMIQMKNMVDILIEPLEKAKFVICREMIDIIEDSFLHKGGVLEIHEQMSHWHVRVLEAIIRVC